jgi:hypothetical protein
MDGEFISEIFQTDEGKILFRQNIKKANELRINASPRLLINNEEYNGYITGNGLSRTICRELPSNESCRFIPVCGTDSDCLAQGKFGTCINSETMEALCKFTEPVNFSLTIIMPTEYEMCRPNSLIQRLKQLFPGMNVRELDHNKEIQEDIRQLCIKKYYPSEYYDYLICLKDYPLNSSDTFNWLHCLVEDIDYQRIEPCTNSQDGMRMLLEDIDLIEELGISISPSYLVNNII